MTQKKQKKILFITNQNPFANSFGAEQRANIFMNAAIANNCIVDVACISPTETQMPTIGNKNITIKLWGYKTNYKPSVFRRFLRHFDLEFLIADKRLRVKIDSIIKADSYDLIMCRYLQWAQLTGLWKYRHKLILDIDDLPLQSAMSKLENDNNHKIINKLLKCPISSIYRFIINRWIKHTYATFLPNEEMSKLWHTRFLPNIPIIHVDNPKYVQSNNILFIGLLSYRPNYMAINHFIDKILPLVVAKYKDVQLLVAGKGLPKDMSDRWKDNPNVKELGFVTNLYDFYNSGNIVICPIQEGSGTNIKVIEAMAMGKACVMSKFSVKGFENVIENGINAYIANDDKDYAEKITALLEDKELCKNMMTEAYKSASEYYSQDTINKILSPFLK